MHSSSKLIIPAKSAQDSPYVPKIRIYLRPSSSLDNNSDMGTSLGTDSLMTDLTQQNHNEENQVGQTINTRESDISLSIEHSQDDIKASQEQIRTSRKRKYVANLDNFDLELPNSVLTKVNLSEIINIKTFESLPIESRKRLLKLLPVHDQQPPADVSISSGESDLWIHPTALRNEFFSKALQDYSTRQMNGDFFPRLNSRQGLRKSVGNRQRYSNSISSPQPALTPQSPSSTKENPLNNPSLLTKHSPDGLVKTNRLVDHLNGGRFRSRSSALQTALTKGESMENTEERKSKETIDTVKLITESKMDPEDGSIQSIPAGSSDNSTSSDNSSSSISQSTKIQSSLTSMSNSFKTSDERVKVQRTASLHQTSSESATVQSTQRRLNMPKLESTLLLQNPVQLPQDYRRKSVGTPVSTGRILQQTSFPSDSLPSSSTSSSRQPLVVDSSSSLSQAQHRTKILADVKKNFIKRKLQQQQQKQSQTSQPAEYSLPNQPNPTNIRPPGENQTSSSNNVTPRVISPSVLIQPSGNSVSAPATPQHGVNGGGSSGTIGAIPVPSILSNYIEAKIVVTPSRSGSSASSNDDNNTSSNTLLDVASEQQSASAECTSSQETARQLSITPQNSQIPPQQQPPQSQQMASPTATGGLLAPATTTRAYFVDGNNLTETLALLQSINPRATVTQQQFLLIPGLNKSHAILCRTPIPIQPRQTPQNPIQTTTTVAVASQQPQPQQSVVVSQQQQILRRSSGSSLPSQQQQPVVTNTRPPLILPVSREVTTHQQVLPQHQQPVSGMYREILPASVNSGAGGTNLQRFPASASIQPQHPTQVQHQLSPAPTAFVGAVTPGALAQSAHGVITVNMRPAHIGASNITASNTTTVTAANNTGIVVGTATNNNPAAQPQAPPTSFFQPPPPSSTK
nr:Polycomb group protein ASXL2 [Hymenolepis microstoma]